MLEASSLGSDPWLSCYGPGPTAGSAGVRTLLADIQLLADLAQEADADEDFAFSSPR